MQRQYKAEALHLATKCGFTVKEWKKNCLQYTVKPIQKEISDLKIDQAIGNF